MNVSINLGGADSNFPSVRWYDTLTNSTVEGSRLSSRAIRQSRLSTPSDTIPRLRLFCEPRYLLVVQERPNQEIMKETNMRVAVIITLVVISRAVTAASTSRSCSICDAGEIIGFPDVTVAIPTIGTFTTCRQV
jgi:hypothetical protein